MNFLSGWWWKSYNFRDRQKVSELEKQLSDEEPADLAKVWFTSPTSGDCDSQLLAARSKRSNTLF